MNLPNRFSALCALTFAAAVCARAQEAPTFTKIVYELETRSLGLELERATLTIDDPTSTRARATVVGSRGGGGPHTLSYELDDATQHELIQLVRRVRREGHQTYTTHLGRVSRPLVHFSLTVEGTDGAVRGGDGYRDHVDPSQGVDGLLALLDSIRFKAAAVPFATREREVTVSIVPHPDPASSETLVQVRDGQANVTTRLRPASVVEALRAYGDGARVLLTGRSVLEGEQGAAFTVESHRLAPQGINQALGGN
ncbi:MAG: hypothetical protein R3F62_29125 [Planctomycetota bacterium]